MTVYFRADASATIGSGHVMRCMTLADRVLSSGQKTHFLCRSLPQSLHELLISKGHAVTMLTATAQPNTIGTLAHSAWLGVAQTQDASDCQDVIGSQKADWIVVDHYALDAEWEGLLRSNCDQLLVIDDLADRKHDCDVLLDQNLGRTSVDYARLVPEQTLKLIGPKHALLRPEFAAVRLASLERRKGGEVKRLLISLGGFDHDNVTGKVLNALAQSNLPKECVITVVMGSQAPWLKDVKAIAAAMPQKTDVLVDVKDMASVMSNADLAIGAAGGTAWERACLGLPTLMFVLAENQETGARGLADEGCAILLQADETLVESLNAALDKLQDFSAFEVMCQASADLTNGQGATRLAALMCSKDMAKDLGLRAMTEADLPIVWGWRNHDDIRKFMLTQDLIALDVHRNWFEKSSKDSTRHLMILDQGEQPSGFMNIKVDPSNNSADWGFYAAPGASKGTGTLMGQAAIAYAFHNLGVNKICGQVLDFNEASLRFHEKLGFQKEGVLRDQARINNEYHALVCFGLLKREWLQSRMRVN